MRLIFDNATYITCVSSYLQRGIQKITKNQHITVIPNVIEFPDRKNVKLADIYNKKNINILHVSLLSDREKNISSLIRVFASLSKIYPNIILHIVGSGHDELKLKKLANKFEVYGSRIIFHGAINNDLLSGFYKNADFFVLSSNVETFSVVAAESLFFGCPVLSTKCGGPEDFINEEVGLLVENSEKSLKDGLVYMVNNYKKFQSSYLSRYAREKFASGVINKKFNKVFDEVIQGYDR